MRMLSSHFLLAVFTLAAASHGSHVLAAAASARASVTLVEPAILTAFSDLQFGRRTVGTGGRVSIGTAADFVVGSTSGPVYSISHHASSLLSRSAGSATMGWTTLSEPALISHGALAAGIRTFHIGGIVQLAPDQAAGEYAGEISVTVEFN